MFLPPKLTAIVLNSLAILLLAAGSSDAQQAEFNRRAAAMQEARTRAQQGAPVRLASNDVGVDYSAPPSPPPTTRVARATRQTTTRQTASPDRRVVLAQSQPTNQLAPQRMAQAPTGNRMASRFVPEHTRTAQLMDSTFVDGGSPIISSGAPGCTSCGSSSYGGQIVGDGYVDGGCDSCGSCGDVGGYFEDGDSCCDRGGCPPGDCWISGLGAVLYNGEYFGGATSFRSALFSTPGVTTAGQLSNDCSHGFYGGFNFGLPLCKLSCGLFSGQIGLRSVQTNFSGNQNSGDNRDQLFVTAGIYRRVDYGIQAGVVVDYLHEEWFSETDIAQIRGDLGWVYPNGSTLGFRYATNINDDLTSGFFAGNAFVNLRQSTSDNYRFYYRHDSPAGGFGEGYVGWTGDSQTGQPGQPGQTVIGLDFDLPICERVAMQSGFAYYLGDQGIPIPGNQSGGNIDEAYNLYVGLVFRPRGISYYRSYDRPLFSVADNGSMLITR